MTPGRACPPTVATTVATPERRLDDLSSMLDDLEAMHGPCAWIALERRRVALVCQSVRRYKGRLTKPFASVLADIESVVLWRLLTLADWVLQTDAFVTD